VTEAPRYRCSLRHFSHRHPQLKQRVAALGVHNRTVERAILRAHPSIVRGAKRAVARGGRNYGK
jgi:hypothetical protein